MIPREFFAAGAIIEAKEEIHRAFDSPSHEVIWHECILHAYRHRSNMLKITSPSAGILTPTWIKYSKLFFRVRNKERANNDTE